MKYVVGQKIRIHKHYWGPGKWYVGKIIAIMDDNGRDVHAVEGRFGLTDALASEIKPY